MTAFDGRHDHHPNAQFCEKCGSEIEIGRERWLELHIDDLTLTDPAISGPLPDGDSQGMFIFGQDCARRILRDGLTWGDGGGAWAEGL